MLHNLILCQGSLVALLKFQMAPKLRLPISSGSKKKEPMYSHKMWTEVSSCVPHLHKELFVSSIK